MEQWTGSTLGKEYIKAVYCYPDHLTDVQSTSCKMPGWTKTISEAMVTALTKEANERGLIAEDICNAYKIKHLRELTVSQHDAVRKNWDKLLEWKAKQTEA